MDYTVHGIPQATILEWVAFPSSRGSSQPRDQTQISCAVGGFFTSWATREAWYEDRSSFLPLRSSFACLIKNNIYSYFNVQFKAISPIVHLEFPPFSCVPTVVWSWLQSFLGKMNRTSWLTECGLESIFFVHGIFPLAGLPWHCVTGGWREWGDTGSLCWERGGWDLQRRLWKFLIIAMGQRDTWL